MAVSKTQVQQTSSQVGKISGLMGACLTVMMGVWRGVSPETILWRAIIVGVVSSYGVQFVSALLHTFFSEEDD